MISPRRAESLLLPPIDRNEVLRYWGAFSPTEETSALLDSCLDECREVFTPRVVFAKTPLAFSGATVDMGFASVDCPALAAHLDGCREEVVFAATVGIGIDRLIRRHSTLSPARASCLQAIGTERIEALCDAFEEKIGREEGETVSRFSPGYGSLPLSLQKDIFAFLDCPRAVGISLGDSLLMTPTKSVTAIIGIRDPSRSIK